MLVCLFGKRGTGKTHLISAIVETLNGPVINFDFLGNYPEVKGKHTDSVKDAAAWLMNWTTEAKEKVLTFKPAQVESAVDIICQAAWEKGNCTLLIDEVDMIQYKLTPHFDYLIRYGRNRGVHMLVACRRPFEISRNITAGANAIYIFQTQEPRDVEYYSKSILGKNAQKLMTLPKYHGIVIDYDRERTGIFNVDSTGQLFFVEKITNQDSNKD